MTRSLPNWELAQLRTLSPGSDWVNRARELGVRSGTPRGQRIRRSVRLAEAASMDPAGPAGVMDALAAAALARALGFKASSNAVWPHTRSAHTEGAGRPCRVRCVHRRLQGHQSARSQAVVTRARSGRRLGCRRSAQEARRRPIGEQGGLDSPALSFSGVTLVWSGRSRGRARCSRGARDVGGRCSGGQQQQLDSHHPAAVGCRRGCRHGRSGSRSCRVGVPR